MRIVCIVLGQKFEIDSVIVKSYNDTKRFKIRQLIDHRFCNGQLEARHDGKIKILNGYNVDEISLAIDLGENGIKVLDKNEISLAASIIKDGEVIGYSVEIGRGIRADIQKSKVINLAAWIKPLNFTIKAYEDGRKYITGRKNVMRLSELPVVRIESDEKAMSRDKDLKIDSNKESEGRHNMNTKQGGAMVHSIEEIFEKIREVGGLVALPGYDGKEDEYVEMFDWVTGVYIGDPFIEYNTQKLNLNIGLYKYGIKYSADKSIKIPARIYKKISLFKGGKSKIKKLGVVGTLSMLKEFEKITGIKFVGKMGKVGGSIKHFVNMHFENKGIHIEDQVGIFELDSNIVENMSIFNDNEASSIYADGLVGIKNDLLHTSVYGIMQKFTSPRAKENKKLRELVMPRLAVEEHKKPLQVYMKIDNMYDVLDDLGVDIDGTVKVFAKKDKKLSIGCTNKEVELSISLYMPTLEVQEWNYDSIWKHVSTGSGRLPDIITDNVADILSTSDYLERYNKISSLNYECARLSIKHTRRIFIYLWKAYERAQFDGLKIGNISDWKVVGASGGKTKRYDNVAKNIDMIAIKVSGVDLI